VTSAHRAQANAFSIDVEDWFHICGVGGALAPSQWDVLPSRVVATTRLLLEDLDRAGVRATFFVLGWVADRHPGLVAEILAAGHEVGSHSHRHTRVYELDPASFEEDLRNSVTALRDAGVQRIAGYRAPEWSINDRAPWALESLARAGITVDASMAPVKIVGNVAYPRHPHIRETPAGPIFEAPPLVADRFGQVMPLGWGWGLRMSAPRQVLRVVDAANRAGVSTVFAVHPWEVDPDPPRVSLPLRLRFAHSFRLDGFRARLAAILAGGSFGPISELERVVR
jgi:polysaccharide deacetylase family protein (PEP-CTERM system associated)